MSFLAPIFLAAAGVAALVIVGLHFLSTREPKLEIYPTTRFLPDLAVQATATTLRPSDLLLLLLRVILVLLVGAALARPVFKPARQPVARIVAVDVSRAVGATSELADSTARYLADAAAVIFFDSAAREVKEAASDSLRALQVEGLARGDAPRGALSAAFIAALRAAARIRDAADSLELVVVSPFAAEEYDAATEKIRSLWPGRVTTVAVAPAVMQERRDSVRVEWADSVASTYWTARASPDTIGAVRMGDAVLVDPFVRNWRLAVKVDSQTRILARWADGEAAAVEHAFAGSAASACLRSIGFALPSEGDVALRPEFQRFIESLTAPCGEPYNFEPLAVNVMGSLRGEGPLAPTAEIQRRVERVTPLMPWLLLAALLLALIELFARRRGRRTASTSDRSGYQVAPTERAA